MQFIVEKICDNFAILEKEDLSQIRVDINLLPIGLKEGNVLKFDGEKYHTDIEAEAQIRKRIVDKQRSIFRK